MKIYQGSIKQFMKLWSYSNSKTYNYFVSGIKNNIIEFWTIELNDELIAELYIFWDSVDKEEANNFNRAYLCAFRVNKNHQGKGLGSLLIRRVLKRIKEKGFKEVSVMYYQLKDMSILNQNDWDKCYEFFFNHMVLLEEAFLDVKEVVMYRV